jgi:cyanophycinase
MGAFVLMGSGEFLPWARDVDRWALDASGIDSDRVIVVPLASAPEGEEVFASWAQMGIAHFEALDSKPEVLDVRTRRDADDPAKAAAIEGARYVFFSGGNPGFLARALEGTAVWSAVLDAVRAGAALGGCSAGMVALGVVAPDTTAFAEGRDPWTPGLELFKRGFLNAHWDALDGYQPGLTQRILEAWPKDSVLFALDEDTAACGDGMRWHLQGKGVLTIPGLDGLERIPANSDVTVDLGLSL